MDLTDMGTGTAMDTKLVICIHTRGTRIRVPGGFPVPVSITNWECQEKQDININIAIPPGSSIPIIDIKFNTTEIVIGKRRNSEEPVGERKAKHVRTVGAIG